MTIMTALQKLGIVEGSEDAPKTDADAREAELATEVREAAGAPAPEAPESASPARATEAKAKPNAPTASPSGSKAKAARPLKDIYSDHRVEESPFPAEKLLTLLDGLKAMPEPVQKQAVAAMDKAEDDWTVQDSLLDARRKISAIKAEQGRIRRDATEQSKRAKTLVKEREGHRKKITADIREQISKLEEALARENSEITKQCEQIAARAQRVQEETETACRRHDDEIKRLARLGELFADHDDIPTNHPEKRSK